MVARLLATHDDAMLALLRLALGVVFFAHGAQKMLGWFGGYGYGATLGAFTGMGIPAPLAFLAICAEFFGGIGLIIGCLSRIAAFGITCNMIVAVALVHWHFGFFMNWAGTQKGEGFEFHILALAMLALVLAKGAGALSVDRLLSRPVPVKRVGASA